MKAYTEKQCHEISELISTVNDIDVAYTKQDGLVGLAILLIVMTAVYQNSKF